MTEFAVFIVFAFIIGPLMFCHIEWVNGLRADRQRLHEILGRPSVSTHTPPAAVIKAQPHRHYACCCRSTVQAVEAAVEYVRQVDSYEIRNPSI